MDLLSTIPFDYILMAFDIDYAVQRWVRLLRMLKYFRIKNYFNHMKFFDNQQEWHYNKILKLGVMFFIFNHLAACIMHSIAHYEYYTGHPNEDNMGIVMDKISIEIERPFMEVHLYAKYTSF